MATKKPAVEIPVRLNKDQAQKDAKGLTNDMVKNFAKIGAGIAAAKVAFDAFSVVMGKAIDLTRQSIALADVQVKAERGLIEAIRQRQAFTDAEFDSLQRFNAEVQQATAIGDEQLLQIQRQLVLQGAEKSQLEDLTKAVIGLSQVKGQGFAEAATVVTRVLRGEVGALKETGIVVQSVNEGIQKLTDNFVFATHETATFGGQVKLLEANFGDMLEEFGKAFIESEGVNEMFEVMNRQIFALAETIKNNRPIISRFFDDIASGIDDVAESLQEGALNRLLEVFEALPLGYSPIRAALRYAKDVSEVVRDPRKGEIITPYAYDQKEPERFEVPFIGGVRRSGMETAYEAAQRQRRELEARIRRQREQARQAVQPELDDGVSMDEAHRRQMEIQQAHADRIREFEQLQLDQTIAANELRFQAELQAFDERQKLKQREIAATENFYQNLSNIGIGGMANFISGIVQAGLSGEADLSQMMVRLFGGMLSQVGQMLISLGTAAFLAATASTALPFLWPITGGPIGAGGALGIVAAGAALTGVGGYVSSTARTTTASLRRVEGTARRMAPSTVDRAGRPSRAQQETTQTVYNINFNGALPGSERRIAREIKRIMSGGFAAAGA